MDKEYILSFSSFYKAEYARDVLGQYGIRSILRRLPPEVAHSCSTGVYLRTDSIQKVYEILEKRQISLKNGYRISVDAENRPVYHQI